jgi:hypothetical protein
MDGELEIIAGFTNGAVNTVSQLAKNIDLN